MERWSIERIAEWYERLPWLCGFNYLPRTAVNWTELWQAESFDPDGIEQELGWAEDVGFGALRTNLQFLVWLDDPSGLRARLDRFLGIAARRGMRTLLCLFDDCAFSGREPYLGRQDDPVPGVHNSGGAASPGRELVRDRSRWPELERYVRDLVSHFRDDERLLGWDLYNEPGNEAVFTREVGPDPRGPLIAHSMALVEASFGWARAERPSQPLTSGVWNPGWPEHNRRLLELSDVTSFHHYLGLAHLRGLVEELRKSGRPLLCTEWLARGLGSLPASHLPYFREQRIGCFHWGLVNGRTQTHLPWPAFAKLAEGGLWHHDLFHPDGTAWDAAEIALFRSHLRGGPAGPCESAPSAREAKMLEGGCLCGGVRFRITGKLGPAGYCHCQMCRRASGSAFAANAPVRTRYFEIGSGAELVSEYESSPGKYRAFCRRCGSPVYSRRDDEPEIRRIRLGSLDGDPGRRPLAHVWVGDKAPWHSIEDALPQYVAGLPEDLAARNR